MSFELDTETLLTGAFLFGLVCLPVVAIVLAIRSGRPKDHPKTYEETYPDEHRFI